MRFGKDLTVSERVCECVYVFAVWSIGYEAVLPNDVSIHFR